MRQSRAQLEGRDARLRTRPSGVFGLSAYLGTFLRSKRALNRSPRTVEEYQRACGAFSEFLILRYGVDDVRRVARRDIEDFLIEYQETRTSTTANKTFRALRAVFNWLWREEELDVNPFSRVEAPPVDTVPREGYTPEDVRAMLRVCRQEQKAAKRRSPRGEYLALRDYALLLVLYDTGLRASEVVAMTVEGVDWEEGLFSVPGKGRKVYTRHLGQTALAAVERYLRLRRRIVDAGEGQLWVGWTGARRSRAADCGACAC